MRSDAVPVLRTIHDEATRAGLVQRLDRLDPDSPRRWGRMTPHQALCHQADLFRFALGKREGPRLGNRLRTDLIKWYALNLPLRWPHGFPTARQFDQERGGTTPEEFDVDRVTLVDLIERFTRPDAVLHEHPLFGRLSRPEWGRWGFRHTDHHLRQFGV